MKKSNVNNKSVVNVLRAFSMFAVVLVVAGSAFGQTAVPMLSQPAYTYTENFSDVTNWTNGFAAGIGANRFGVVAVNATGAIPDGVKTTASSATFSSASSGGVQKGTGNIVMLSTGTTDNSTSVAFDVFMDFTGGTAGKLSFDWAAVANGTGNRNSSLRVYWSIDGTTFTEITGAQVLNLANNVAASGVIASVTLPTAFDNVSTARLRFYECNGVGGTTGSRSKISIDNLSVTAGGPLDIQTLNALPNAVEMSPYTTPLVSAGGVGPYTYAVTAGTLPAGLTLNTNGTWAGMPNMGTAGVYGFDVTVTDSNPFSFSKGLSSFAPNTKTETFSLRVSAPSAAPANVTGRLNSTSVKGLANANVSITNASTGEIKRTRSNQRGYFNFQDLEVGNLYIIEVQSKRFVFNNYSFTLNEDLTDLVLTAQ
jgi:hypothetical protein